MWGYLEETSWINPGEALMFRLGGQRRTLIGWIKCVLAEAPEAYVKLVMGLV